MLAPECDASKLGTNPSDSLRLTLGRNIANHSKKTKNHYEDHYEDAKRFDLMYTNERSGEEM